MTSRYSFCEYSPEWKAEYEREASRLNALLGDSLITIHHIGSTSVPGLAAKPVIDLLPVARELKDIDSKSPLLENAGYDAWGEYGLPGRRYFTKEHQGFRTHNIHIFEDANSEVERHVAFRDYLRAHDNVRDQYALLKGQLFAQFPTDIDAYCDGKDAWIKRTERTALEWFRSRPVS